MAAVRFFLLASLVCAVLGDTITTPSIQNPTFPDRQTTAASVTEPTVTNSDGSVPNGVNADQEFQGHGNGALNGIDTDAGATNNEPDEVVTTPETGSTTAGRRLSAAGRKLLQGTLQLTGNGVSAGEGGNGVSTVASGHGEVAQNNGDVTDTHFQPHGDTTTVTADGKQTSTGAAVNPDNADAGEGQPTVVVGSGRK